MKELTKIQQKAYDFVKDHLLGNGYPPTIRELKEHMGYSAIGSAQSMVEALRRKGFLMIPEKQTARSLVPVNFSEMISQATGNR